MRLRTLTFTCLMAGTLSCSADRDTSFVKLWDPFAVTIAQDGLYVPLPHAQQIAFLDLGAENDFDSVDLGGGAVGMLTNTPNGVAALVDTFRCVEPDTSAEDCPAARLRTDRTLWMLNNGALSSPYPVAPTTNRLAVSDDGTVIIAHTVFERTVDVQGIATQGEADVIHVDSGAAFPVTLDQDVTNIVFGPLSERALAVTPDAVSLLNLTNPEPQVVASFPLTLDPDNLVAPGDITFTSDGSYALVSSRLSGDLYVLDLERHVINLLELSDAPATMIADADFDRSLAVSQRTTSLDVVDHATFSVTPLELDAPMTDAWIANNVAVLWNRNLTLDGFTFDIEDDTLREFRFQAFPYHVSASPNGAFALAFTTAGSVPRVGVDGYDVATTTDEDTRRYAEDSASYAYGAPAYVGTDQGIGGLEVVDLSGASIQAFALQTQGIAIDWVTANGSARAAILQQHVPTLFVFDPVTSTTLELPIEPNPVALHVTEDQRVVVVHANPLGLISIVDVERETVESVSGFAAIGALVEPQPGARP